MLIRRAAACCVTIALLAKPLCAADPVIEFRPAKTPGGMGFHHRFDATTPFAAIHFGFRDLYALTTLGKVGLSSLGGALVMQGADGAGQTEFIERLRDLSASASVSFGAFTTQGNVRAPAATLPAAMDLLASTLKGAKPSEKVLARLRQQAIGGEAQAAIRAETIAQRATLRLALGDHPFNRALDPGRFDRITVDDIGEWRKRTLDRAKLRIVVSGRVVQDEAGRLIDRAFGDLPERLAPISFTWPKINVPALTVVVEHDTQQSAIIIVGLTSIGSGIDAETGIVANAVLGGSSSRLWRAVRERLGSTYGASSGFQAIGPGQRLIRLSAAVANDQVKASVEALRSTYGIWREKGITAEELKATTTRVVNDFRSAFDEPARANGMALGMLLANRPLDSLLGYESRMTQLKLDDVNAFIAAKFPTTEQLLTVIVTPRADGLGADCTVRALEEIERCRR